MLIRLTLGVLLLIMTGILGKFFFVKFLVIGGFLTLAIWSFKEAQYDPLETTMGKIYLGVGGFATIILLVIPAIMGLLSSALSVVSSGGGILFLLVVAYIIWGNK
ncbi:hypothetical protein [Bacillus thuringiensis]|uniref:hypothetical protein n=1 Tax=Bacillus thuringiensis TaxID=1428 RepID=UPI00300E6B0B